MESRALEKTLVLRFRRKRGRVLHYIIRCECRYFRAGPSDRSSGRGVASIFHVSNFPWVGHEDATLLKGKDIGGQLSGPGMTQLVQ